MQLSSTGRVLHGQASATGLVTHASRQPRMARRQRRGARWEVPAAISVCDVHLDGGSVAIVRQHGNPAGPRLVLGHGNGLAIDLYLPFWSLLQDDFELMTFDLRNHGWNEVGDRRDHNIPTLIADHDRVLRAIRATFGDKPTVGVHHSLSALVAIMSMDQSYAALVLFDPPLCKPAGSEAEFDLAAERTAAMIRKRTDRFRTPDEFAALLGFFPGFARLAPGVRQLMAETTLRRCAGDQCFELRCPREYEAQIAEYVRSFAPLLDLNLLNCPTKVIGADPTQPYAYLPTFDLGFATALEYDFVPDSTHFLPLEQPAECAAMLREFLAKQPFL